MHGAGELPGPGERQRNVQVFTPDANAQPLMAQKDKTAVTVRWAAHDDNGDDLIYSCGIAGWARRTGCC